MASEMIKGLPLSRAMALTNQAVAGLPANKLHCSVQAEQAVKAAIQDYYDKNQIPYDPADFAKPEEIQVGE